MISNEAEGEISALQFENINDLKLVKDEGASEDLHHVTEFEWETAVSSGFFVDQFLKMRTLFGQTFESVRDALHLRLANYWEPFQVHGEHLIVQQQPEEIAAIGCVVCVPVVVKLPRRVNVPHLNQSGPECFG
jgi:hypothetical protein